MEINDLRELDRGCAVCGARWGETPTEPEAGGLGAWANLAKSAFAALFRRIGARPQFLAVIGYYWPYSRA
jgi:hypothetical protein